MNHPARDHVKTALARSAAGDHAGALRQAVTALMVEDCDGTRDGFVACIRAMQFFEDNDMVRALLLRAFRENWCRPEDLALPAADLIRAAGTGLQSLSQDSLLSALLCSTPNQDGALEDALVAARAYLLRAPDQSALAFHCALARQCFLNEYVFAVTGEEEARLAALEKAIADALDRGTAIAPGRLAALASYRPLADARLLDRSWPAPLEPLLTQQLREPREEKVLAAALPDLTPLNDTVSRQVARQYEDNPYPRWTCAGPPRPAGAHAVRDILVAGCGTGRNAIEAAQAFADARVLAIDLSRASLGHAARKARQMGLENIAFAQADILEMGGMADRFDLIEAVGVLHHLADPFAGWRILTGLLRPHRLMKVGLYSATARSRLGQARAALAEIGFTGDLPGLRAARAWLRSQPEFVDVVQRPDFFTASNCRDLLFHVQEASVDLSAIAAFLREHNLTLMGFDLEETVLARYRAFQPGDSDAVNLDTWAEFEKQNPATFEGMYQFWVRTAGSP